MMKTLGFTMGALLAACSDNQLHSMRDDARADAAGIEVTPARIDFGAVTDAEGVAVQAITITSVGTSDLLIEDISIEGKDAAQFRVVDEATSFLLPAGASMTIDVEFEPGDSLEAVGQVVVTSDDPVRPVLPVDLVGSDAISQLAIEPDPVDFGVVEVGCEATRSLDLVSVGDEPVTVDSILTSSNGYALSYGFSLPQVLQPGERLSVDVTFAPADQHDFPGTLEVVSDDYYGDATARQFGAGIFEATHEDRWSLEDLRADILFYVDHSGSMDDDAALLATNFSSFISDLNDYASDWQVVVADNLDGCNLEGILSPSTAGYGERFTDAVTDDDPYVGTHDEAGLTVASLAVDATDPGDCNAGFLRPDALLHVIMVSDEVEQSTSSWDYYVDRIVAKKGDASLVRMSAILASSIIGRDPTGGYEAAVAATDGVLLALDADWAASMAELADATVTQSTFPLSAVDVVATSIVVTVDGQAASGWTFDATTNSVVFDAATAPKQGSTVVVDYGTYSTCE
jgi:hypothetical protein